MNYSRKKSDGFFTKLFGSLIKAAFILAAVFLFCGGVGSSEKMSDAEPVTVEVPYDVYAKTEEEEATTFDDGFINPTVGVLTSNFGYRWERMHNGIDIGAQANTEIYAADDGVVTYAGQVSGYGNYVVINHENGFETAYAHCNSIATYEGAFVEKGDVIAYVGSTGNSTGPHLHFEIKENGEFKNPLDYVTY